MMISDAALAAVPHAPRGPLRALLSFFGLTAIADDRADRAFEVDGVVSPPDWQQARVAAHRAVAAIDLENVDAAEAFFTTAFTLDQTLNPAQIANFWRMSLTGLEVAERALRSVGRYDDAAALASEVAFRFAAHPSRQPSQAAS